MLSTIPKHPPGIKKNLDNPVSYQHEVLPPGYIRLIRVESGKPEDPIELTMYSTLFRLGDRTEWLPAKYVPQYEALSYTWDEDEKKDRISRRTSHQKKIVRCLTNDVKWQTLLYYI
ncbi:hypothetical protein BPAE_0005g01110 [Botrytis paeoniae]|uniref:Uncharacterized protein n=1 Tax=Botrytis paeoniae TaxID=278948 RepID=A0A4Z1G134_9HELO|nr:hypothetical protein BPAE_0005g01110 [Botrytis paeoniae]